MEMNDIDFLIIGAAKSATTWLQRMLQTDPAVYMPDPELHYFSREYHRGDGWYLDQFDCDGPKRLVGEKSNSYLEEPKAVARIAEALPHVSLIAQLRDPVERAYSDYCMLYRRGEVNRNIEDHLHPARAADGRFIACGQYRDQLNAFLDHFPKDRFLFLVYEDVAANPEQQLAWTRQHLGLPQLDALPAQPGRVKDKRQKVVPPALKPWLKPLKPLVAPLRQNKAFRAANALLQREIDYPPLSDDLRARLESHYAPQIEGLEKLMGRDLSIWRHQRPD